MFDCLKNVAALALVRRACHRGVMPYRLAALLIASAAAATSLAQFEAKNIELYAQLTPAELGAATGNDCWGYISPSGREYALMGLNDRMAVVEVTDPSNPSLIESITHTSSIWAGVKSFDEYAYVVNESGGGLDVVDLTAVDDGVVSLVDRLTPNGFWTAHNIAVDEASGFLYTVGANIANGGMVAWNLANPERPTMAGAWTGSYIHDAQVVTYDSGPYAGRQIAFCCTGLTGLDIIDVTDKSSMTRLSNTTYDTMAYCHQAWLSEDRQYLYLNDEEDELFGLTPTTRTYVFDVSDLSKPQLVNTFTTGLSTIDHNLYVRDGFVYEANYTSGIHIFDARMNPTDPEYVGFFDTYPANNRTSYDGAWTVYPFLSSGVLIASDQANGLFILDPSDAIGEPFALTVDRLIGGQPATLTATGATAGARVYFAYSLRGRGSTFVPALNVTLDLDRPALAGSDVADANGVASFTQSIPPGASGRNVWIQAAENKAATNVVEGTIQ